MKDRCPRNMLSKGLFSVASVFLCICVSLVFLVGCGMPNPIGLDSSAYSWPTATRIYDANGITVGYEFELLFQPEAASKLSERIFSGTTPSIMLFYTLTNAESPPTGFSSRFASAYMPSKAFGKNLFLKSTDDYTVVSYPDSADSSYLYRLFPLRWTDISLGIPNAPQYLIYPQISSFDFDSHCSFTAKIELFKDSLNASRVGLLLTTVDSQGNSHEQYLVRSIGNEFVTSTEEINSAISNNLDYEHLVADEHLYLHLYAAFNLTPSKSKTDSDDLFSNIFWGDLVSVGTLQLTF